MGYARPRPKRLAQKLLQIRQRLGLSQSQLSWLIEVDRYTDISKFEHDKNEPSLMTLLNYARIANVRVEDLIDDELSLEI